MITTVCMNPSFDKTATVAKLETGHVNLLSDVRFDIGGKGINVAVVLQRLQIEVGCVGCLGAADEATFAAMIEREHVPFRYLLLPGNVRTNFKLLDLHAKTVTEFNEPGLHMDEAQQEEFLQLLRTQAQSSSYVVLSGRLPLGCPETTYQRCIRALDGKPCILDTAGEALLHGIKEMPFLVKPNLPEMEAIMHKELRTLRSIRDAALMLIQYGAQNVIISMGKYGAMYTNGTHTLFAPALQVDAKSSVGAGDAMIGGVVMGLARGMNLTEAFKNGVAAGAASVMTDGTQLIQVEDFERLLPKVTLQEV